MNDFVGKVQEHIATYAIVKQTGKNREKYTYSAIDLEGNVFAWECEEDIENADGQHYFLVEGTICDHRKCEEERQTILSECDAELIDRLDKIKGEYYGKVGDKIELAAVTAKYRRRYGVEWKVTGEYSLVTPVSEYRLIAKRDKHTFIVPYDSVKRLPSKKMTGRDNIYNIYGKVIGYTIEKNARATFIYPTSVTNHGGELVTSMASIFGRGGIFGWR